MKPQQLRNAIVALKKEFGPHFGRDFDTLVAEFSDLTIPTSAFNERWTVYEGVVAHLASLGLNPTQIAQQLNRKKSSIQTTLKHAKDKGFFHSVQANFQDVPLKAFKANLGPAESVILFLHNNKKLGATQIAELVCRDPRNVWAQLQKAKKKTGGKKRG